MPSEGTKSHCRVCEGMREREVNARPSHSRAWCHSLSRGRGEGGGERVRKCVSMWCKTTQEHVELLHKDTI